jgi:hypothetical protein
MHPERGTPLSLLFTLLSDHPRDASSMHGTTTA